MIIGKLKKIQVRLLTQEQQLGFHLDDQQAALALQAKKQLEQCSQEIMDDFTKEQIVHSRKQSTWTPNLRDSNLTRSSQNLKKKSSFKKPHKKTFKKQTCKKCQNHEHTSKQKQKTELAVKKQGINNSLQLEPKLQQKVEIGKTFNQIKNIPLDIVNDKKKHSLFGIAFRSLSTKPEVKQNLKRYRIYTARRQKNSLFFQYPKAFSKTKLYNFNETFYSGNSFKSTCKTSRFLTRSQTQNDENQRAMTSRETPKIDIRPQFLRLIVKIKQKNEQKRQKRLMIKGSRNGI